MLLRPFLLLLPIALISGFASGQLPREFKGKFQPELRPDMVHVYQRLFDAGKPAAIAFEPKLKAGVLISSGALSDQTHAEGKRTAYLVEVSGSDVFLAIDLNNDAVIGANERFPLRSADDGTHEAVINISIVNPLFKSFPIFVRYHRGFTHPQLPKTSHLLEQSVWALAFGNVDIGGKPVLMQYPFEPGAPTISTTQGLFGIDVNGDGAINDQQFSAETSYASGEELVFRYGGIFLSTSRIDLMTNKIVVRERRKEEYFKIELEVGKTMPDFKFVDFAGKHRSLSDFRGEYLLVDFWGVWCFDCLQETPYHVAAYKKFRSRGFNILSINTDENIDIVRDYMKKNGMEWTQARNESVRQLIERDYRIQEYPSTILLGPDGRVLVLDQDALRGERLNESLEGLLAK